MSANLKKSENKRKRPAKKLPVSQKRIKRAAAAYHSSSSEDEDEDEVEPIRNHAIAEKLAALDQEDEFSSGDSEDDEVDTKGGVHVNIADDVPQPESLEEANEINTDDDEPEDEDIDMDEDLSNSGSEDSDSSSGASSTSSSNPTPGAKTARTKPKRHDPTTFASSIQHILSSKLTTTQRPDPVLSRSSATARAAAAASESKLEAAARRKLREDKRALQDSGRVRDVLGVEDDSGIVTAEVLEEEKRLRKMAQRGVVKLFNAVRAAQVKAEEQDKRGREDGLVGVEHRKEKIGEMSKNAFLDLLVEGGKAK